MADCRPNTGGDRRPFASPRRPAIRRRVERPERATRGSLASQAAILNAVDPSSVDLSTCAREPIHIPGSIQPHGILIACALPAWIVSHVSANAPAALGRSGTEELIGLPLAAVLSERLIHDARNALQVAMISGTPERLPARETGVPGLGRCDVAVHAHDALAFIEISSSDVADTASVDPSTLVRAMIGSLKRSPNIPRFLALAAQQVRSVTGYDRVMVYKFLEDGSGEVAAEALRGDLSPYLGLRYPESDIPAQARALYKRQFLRLIPDIDYVPTPLVPALRSDGRPVDLGLATLRSVSPVHIEYLRNMGTLGTLTVSIMRGDELWGLIACHHDAPRRLSGSVCAAIELFGQVLSIQLEAREQEETLRYMARSRDQLDKLLATMAPEDTIFDNLAKFSDQLRAMIPCDGLAVWSDGKLQTVGDVPPEESLIEIIRFLAARGDASAFVTDHLAGFLPNAHKHAETVAGVLAIPFSRLPADFVLLFRRELVRTVTWGGNPNKPVEPNAAGGRISPRKSFEAWSELVRGHSAPWLTGERQIADALRISLLEVILRRADMIHRERVAAQEKQAFLIAELNHRVKNILAVISSLVRQSRSSATSVESFTMDIERRVRALGYAHDQLILSGWRSAPLRQLLEAEALAWTSNVRERVILSGPEMKLEARAYQALALVVHELMTNAAKYGALSVPAGRIAIAWSTLPSGALELSWTERDGPRVEKPTRRGFGSTVIEQTIPFELKGEAHLALHPEGLQATFRLPPGHATEIGWREEAPPPARVVTNLRGKRLLLVEDSMMIALDAQTTLEGAGATVEVAASVLDARRSLSLMAFDAAILDVNLFGETSFELADHLKQLGMPFIFATGYGEGVAIPDRFADVAIIPKPYEERSLRETLPVA
ncbi:HWE histidine kinase domain-containing protein [Methylopila capsulata]|uniref:HWE histidine kinase domain-containing protein n=1 Tax=Methylopila capsulata TaxID=61654 RepID=UPI0022F33E7A|nr:HWE histidine kinase domain-containing protein [Methylopila capsulata]